ncbi:phospholipase D family protein [Pedobacter gandavensis]|uniref:phospholipase D family protein n=1 Tax=Pedobacter gandavensis TaxID=2679963 RepID=UPI002479EAE7|nr:phospholipase D family protein [Pedobacter gandavensis]WGQ11864.1 phospholipase D family protein [Pedobacter gandavensis]
MYISTLEDTIVDELATADELWIATGLITKSGLPYIKDLNAQIHVLVGIDLPTPPKILRELMELTKKGKIQFKVFSVAKIFFHPKVYIWRKKGNYKAYVGSGNLTEGGWKKNTELFWEVDKEAECQKLVEWFNVHMKMGIVADEKFIHDYEQQVFKPNEDASKAHLNRLEKFKIPHENDYEFYFRKEDFDAFTYERVITDNSIAKNARRVVNRKLLDLHYRIYPNLLNKGWELHHHSRTGNIVSSFAHTARNSKTLDGMWLYYGKSEEEAAAHPAKRDEEKSMNNHVRLQIIIRNETVGIWCAVGKGGGSIIDRMAFYEKMKVEENQLEFFRLIKNLGQEYFITLAGRYQAYKVSDIETPGELYLICMQDHNHIDEYFIIGMDLFPNDERLRDDRIEALVLDEFEKLYPVYNFFRAPLS